MSKSALSLIVALIAIGIGSVEAAFVIKLRNGNEFVTARYWQDGGQVLFDVYNGIFGVDKSFIVTINRSDRAVKPEVDAIQIAEEKAAAPEVKTGSEPNKSRSNNDETKSKHAPDDPIVMDFELLKKRFASINGMLTSELDEFSKNVAGLKRRIQTSSAPNNYFNEFTELHEIGDQLENALKKRNQ